ncbi:MAG: hypothetical protein JXA43_00205 [Candidatus Diapherotrites archaeon]|nr:hypothetical protein [Candidatus Diapherotrites archaeon]
MIDAHIAKIDDLILYDPDLIKYCNLMLGASKTIHADLTKFRDKLDKNPIMAVDGKKRMIKEMIPKLTEEFKNAKTEKEIKLIHAKLHIWPSFWYSLCTAMLGAGWFQSYIEQKIRNLTGKNTDIIDVLQKLSEISREKTAVYQMYEIIAKIKPKLKLSDIENFNDLINKNKNYEKELMLTLCELTKIYDIEENPKDILLKILLSDFSVKQQNEEKEEINPELVKLYSWVVKSQKEFVQINEKETYPLLMGVMAKSGLKRVADVAEFIKSEGL